MKNPFLNDPFAMVWQAFQNLYPDKNCDVYWDPNLQPDEAGKSVYGVTCSTMTARCWFLLMR